VTPRRVLAVDVGTSSVKAAVFDDIGRLYASASAPQQFVGLSRNGREHDPARTWGAVKDTIRAVLSQARLDAGLTALSVTGPRGTVAYVDARREAISNFLTWQDQRAAAVISALAGRLSGARYERLTGMGYLPTAVLPKLVWAQLYDPRLATAAKGITTPQGYVLRHLGSPEDLAEPSVAAHTGLLELSSRYWSHEIVGAFGLDRLTLPTLVPTNSVVGTSSGRAETELGIPLGTPLVLAGSDGICSEIGLGVTRPGQLYAYLGTASAVAGPVAVRQRRQALSSKGLIRMPGRGPGLDRIVALGGAGASAAEWATGALGLGHVQELDELAGAAAPGAGGALFVSTLAGATSPAPGHKARGAFLGLSFGHRSADLARAVLEGIAIELRSMLDMCSQVGLVPSEVRLCGGGTRSSVWRQIIADVLQLPLLSTPGPDAGLRGAAISGLSAVTETNLEDLAAAWSSDLTRTSPTPSLAGCYEQLVDNYCLARRAFSKAGLDNALFDTAERLAEWWPAGE
jgi:gluconokinase